MNQERIQKVLAKAGIASRRKAELLILKGVVTVNGKKVTELGVKVDPINDKIKVNGQMILTEIEHLYIALYKPKGVLSSLGDDEGRPHLGQMLKPIPVRVTPIGRMDFNSEGLILLTNDGTLGEKIFKSKDITKTYLVKIKGHPTLQSLEVLKKGFFTSAGVVRFASYKIDKQLKNKSWLKLEVSEGAKLDLRELLNQKGLMVDRIIRTAIGNITLKTMEPGEYRFVKKETFENLLTN